MFPQALQQSPAHAIGSPPKKEAAPFGTACSGERVTSVTRSRDLQGQSAQGASLISALTLSEAQAIAEGIVGPVQWRGAEGFITCPGAALHTTTTTTTDCKVVCEPVAYPSGTLAPGCYCFHDSCDAEVRAVSFAVRSALGKRAPSLISARSLRSLPTRPLPKLKFDPAKLEKIASKLPIVDADYLAARSYKRVDNRTPASFLHELYRPGERVVVFDVFESQGQTVWEHREPPFNACELDAYRTGKPNGVWILANPVSGEFAETGKVNDDGTPHVSRRSWLTVTAWRNLVLESDQADPEHWLAALAQMPLPIGAIYTSAGKSVHALVRMDAGSKAEWDDGANRLKPALVTLGADRKAISAVRLTRLPCCERLGTTDKAGAYIRYPAPRMQRLLYLNGTPDGTPICEREVRL